METNFQIQCFGWVDRDNNGDGAALANANWFTYVLVLSKHQILFSRSYSAVFEVLLPPGDPLEDWDLEYEIWVVDILGGATVALKS